MLLLRAWSAGDQAAFDRVVPIIYRELHKLAAAYTAREQAGRTLSPTDSVSEAYLRLARSRPRDLERPLPFLRHRRSPHARDGGLRAPPSRRQARRRDTPITLDENLFADERPSALLALDDALSESRGRR